MIDGVDLLGTLLRFHTVLAFLGGAGVGSFGGLRGGELLDDTESDSKLGHVISDHDGRLGVGHWRVELVDRDNTVGDDEQDATDAANHSENVLVTINPGQRSPAHGDQQGTVNRKTDFDDRR